MTGRRAVLRAGGAVAAGLAAAAATAPAARAASEPGPDRLALLSWHAALANRRYEPAVVAAIGSSSTEGVGTTRHGRGYVAMLAENLRTRFPVPGAAGGGNYVAAWGDPKWWPVSRVDGEPVADTGWALKAVALRGTLTLRFTGTSLQVWYSARPGGGRFAVTIDGETRGTVDADAPRTDRNAVWASGPLPGGHHTVTVTALTPGPVVHGFATFDGDETRGIQVYNGGHGGRTSGDFAAGAGGWAPRLATIRPHLVLLQLGVNDWRTGVPAATVKRNLKTIIEAVRAGAGTDPSFVIYGSPRVGEARLHGFGALAQVWREVAAEDTGGPAGGSAVAHFDLTTRQPAPSAGNHLGLHTPDLIHMTDKGAAHTADALAAFISPDCVLTLPAAGPTGWRSPRRC